MKKVGSVHRQSIILFCLKFRIEEENDYSMKMSPEQKWQRRYRIASVGRREAGWVRSSGVRGEEERVVVDNESGQL